MDLGRKAVSSWVDWQLLLLLSMGTGRKVRPNRRWARVVTTVGDEERV